MQNPPSPGTLWAVVDATNNVRLDSDHAVIQCEYCRFVHLLTLVESINVTAVEMVVYSRCVSEVVMVRGVTCARAGALWSERSCD